MIPLREHDFEGVAKTHLKHGLHDFQTLCGSSWDDGQWRDVQGQAPTCVACRIAIAEILKDLGIRAPRWASKSAIADLRRRTR